MMINKRQIEWERMRNEISGGGGSVDINDFLNDFMKLEVEMWQK